MLEIYTRTEKRIRDIVSDFIAGGGTEDADYDKVVAAFQELIARARAEEREACARIIRGQGLYGRPHYREWPAIWLGNRSVDSELVKFCDAAVTAIRARGDASLTQSRRW